MAPNCSICFESYKEPMCLPCGHMYCKDCLSDHVNVHTNTGLTSTCPECRTEFSLVVPNLACLPPKYHPFISHATRRVFTDLTPNPSPSALENRFKALSARLAADYRTKAKKLTARCESLADTVRVHRRGERHATERVAQLQARLRQTEKALEEQKAKGRERDKRERENKLLRRENLELAQRVQELEASYAETLRHTADADASSDGSRSPGFSHSLAQSGYNHADDYDSEAWDWYGIEHDHEREDEIHTAQASSSNAQPCVQPSASSSTSTSSASTRARAIKPLPRRASRTREREEDDDDDAAVMSMHNAKRVRVTVGQGRRG